MSARNALIAVGVVASLLAGAACGQTELRTYETRYYVLHTDLDPEGVQEVVRRITLMAEEFHDRTRGFAGGVNQRLPMYVFRRLVDYQAAGGMPGSAGVFTGGRLMAVAGQETGQRTWHVIQHEAFHQFAHAALGPNLPPWVNEGLAEYFGYGLFTGDDFYTGLIPPALLKRVQQGIRDEKFRPLTEIMQLDQEIWNTEIKLTHGVSGFNYLQAWAMVQFLAHANDGRYQDAFADFLRAVSRRQPWAQAWVRSFGNDIGAFEQRWQEYWLKLPDDPTEEKYAEATVATVTSFYARAFSQRQFFDTFADFVAAAEAGELKAHAEDWLPPKLLAAALARSAELGKWSLRRRGQQAVLCKRTDGTVFEGRFRCANRRVTSVYVVVKPPKKRP